MMIRTIGELKDLPAFQDGWKNAGVPLLNFLGERLLARCRSGDAPAAKEIATLIEELRTVGLSASEPKPPRMPPLHSMSDEPSTP